MLYFLSSLHQSLYYGFHIISEFFSFSWFFTSLNIWSIFSYLAGGPGFPATPHYQQHYRHYSPPPLPLPTTLSTLFPAAPPTTNNTIDTIPRHLPLPTTPSPLFPSTNLHSLPHRSRACASMSIFPRLCQFWPLDLNFDAHFPPLRSFRINSV
jgi:hypothetical protein